MTSSRSPIAVGVSLMLEPEFAEAVSPILEAGEVDVLEWSFDTRWGSGNLPAWADELIRFYGSSGALLGHGVSFSLLTAEPLDRQRAWLEKLRGECSIRTYRHVSEHFGFMTAGDFHQGTPLPVPRTEALARLGAERLVSIADACGVPVGLENLAFAFSIDDVREQGEFLDELLRPVNGFILLDLHNLYCQACNFDLELDDLLACYPLERVRELHVSGGSWSEPAWIPGSKPVRRDTHDEKIPERIFEWLPDVIARCPAVEAVIFEQLGNSLGGDGARRSFREDFLRLKRTVSGGRQ